MPFLKSLFRLVIPRSIRPSLRASWTLMADHGHVRSSRGRQCVDARGEPIPWFSYPAVEYLKQLDLEESAVFEYGAGSSTLFWGQRVRRVVSVEHQPGWHIRLSKQIPENVTLLLQADLEAYPSTIDEIDESFDVIVVDGLERRKCCARALERLEVGGLIVLDNSDWYPESAALLREGGLLQVDLAGFAPLSGHTTTTSLFFHRAFRPRPRGARLPMPAPGSIFRETAENRRGDV